MKREPSSRPRLKGDNFTFLILQLARYYLFFFLSMQRTFLTESPACVTKGRLLQTSLHNWTNVVKKVSTSTVRRRLCEADLYGRIAVKKPLLRKQNNVKRLQWTYAHKDWTIQQCNIVLWTDESKFKIFQLNRNVYVPQRVGEIATNLVLHQTLSIEVALLRYGAAFPITKSVICTRWRVNCIRLAISAFCSIIQIPSGTQLVH